MWYEKCNTCAKRFSFCNGCINRNEYIPDNIASLYPKTMIVDPEIRSYIDTDTKITSEIFKSIVNSRFAKRKVPTIKNVIFNDPATIVFWSDNTKTVVKTQNGEEFDPEKGLAMAISKKALGNEGSYYNDIKKHVEKYYANYVDTKSKLKKLADGLKEFKVPRVNVSIAFGMNNLTYEGIYKDFLEHYPCMDNKTIRWTAALEEHHSILLWVGGHKYCYNYDTKILHPVAD